jgi:hypothetical protein
MLAPIRRGRPVAGHVTTGTPIHSASQVVGRAVERRGVESDVDFVVRLEVSCGHPLAELDPRASMPRVAKLAARRSRTDV